MKQFGGHLLTIAAGAAGAYFLREYFAGGVCTNTARLDNKTVIITGCNRYVVSTIFLLRYTRFPLDLEVDIHRFSSNQRIHFFTVVLEKTLLATFTNGVLKLLWHVET